MVGIRFFLTLLAVCQTTAQIRFKTAVKTTDCCAGADCGLKDYKLDFPTEGSPGFSFSVTGTLPKTSDAWHLELLGTLEGQTILNASTSGCGKVKTPIFTSLVGSVEIDFPPCPVTAGSVTVKGKVTLRIPVPYGFGAVVSVRITDGADKSGQLLNCEDIVVSSTTLPPPPKAGAEVVVAGDSWGTFGAKPFEAMFTKHGANVSIYNMAAGGTTSDDWSHGAILDALAKSVSLPETKYIWFTFGGNDAIEHLPFCALETDPLTGKGKTIDQCTDELMVNSTRGIKKILERVKAANPKVRVVGFGYDIMGLGKLPACPLIAPEIMPQCKDKVAHPEGFVHCFNQQFLKIQGVWDTMATTEAGLGIVDRVNLLGTLQAHNGDAKASIGHPDLDKWGPSNLYQINCIHPSEDKGFPIVFDKFWDLYWSKKNFRSLESALVV